jgi:hypothetical protein
MYICSNRSKQSQLATPPTPIVSWRPLPTPLVVDPSRPSTKLQVPDSPVPCRRCLCDSEVGEELYLLSYDPFINPGPAADANADTGKPDDGFGGSPYRCASPIFVHKRHCEFVYPSSPASERAVLATTEEQLRRRVAVRAYDAQNMMRGSEIVPPGELLDACRRLLASCEDAVFCHAHYALQGCFATRVDRVVASV